MVSHQRLPPDAARMHVIIDPARARTDDAASAEAAPGFCSTRCQAASACAQAGITPVPEVQVSSGWAVSTADSAGAPECE